MAENVKIVIREINETTPTGAGVGSDVAYVPGITYLATKLEYTDRPVLCSSISEFETYFGKEPYKIVANDVTSVSENYNGMTVGNPDPSYIYAKELILAGIPVYYDAIVYTTTEREEAVKATTKTNRLEYINDLNTAVVALDAAKQAILEPTAVLEYGSPAYEAAFDEALSTKSTSLNAEDIALVLTYNEAVSDHTTAFNALSNFYSAHALTVSGGYLPVMLDVSGSVDNAGGTIASYMCDCDETAPTSRIKYFYDNFSTRLQALLDKDEYTVKYITSGGYPTFITSEDMGNATAMLTVAGNRGDAVALIDHKMDNDAPLAPTSDPYTIYSKVNSASWANGQYGAMFTPYGTYSLATYTDNTVVLPASFAYLRCLATAIKTSPNWLAMAGVTRGVVPGLQNLNTRQILSNTIAEDYQPKFGTDTNRISINAITNIKPYGLTIWGNRTLQTVSDTGTNALNFLNTRNMVSDIKKVVRNAAKTLMFEQDSEVLWNKFKSRIAPTLDKLKSGFGISDYKILRAEVKPHNGDSLTKGELGAIIRIYPLYAIEYFDISVIISDPDAQ